MDVARGMVASVNVSGILEFDYRDRKVTSAIWKSPVGWRMAARGVNIEGDVQADRKVHGGPDKALQPMPSGTRSGGSDRRKPGHPGGHHHGKPLELDPRSHEWAHDGLSGELPPQRARDAVVHELVASVEQARRAKLERLVADLGDLGGIHDSGAAERSTKRILTSIAKRSSYSGDDGRWVGSNVCLPETQHFPAVVPELVRNAVIARDR